MNKAAILLIAFNRPETTKLVFDCIRKHKPSRLYMAVDGPRKNNANDIINCDAVKALIKLVDWECEVKFRFSDVNLGCKYGVVSAINWFFDNEDEGIILEDDIIPSEVFFKYCELMLKRYRFDKIVKAILGFNYYGQEVNSNEYFFYEGFYPWGWATWKRAWVEYTSDAFELEKLDQIKREKSDYKYLCNTLNLNLSLVRNGLLDTWDYQFMFMIVTTNGVVVAPRANLTMNIGANGAHSINNVLDFKYGRMNYDLISGPSSITIDEEMNRTFLMEHKECSKLIFLKKMLLRFSLYKIARKVVRTYSIARTNLNK